MTGYAPALEAAAVERLLDMDTPIYPGPLVHAEGWPRPGVRGEDAGRHGPGAHTRKGRVQLDNPLREKTQRCDVSEVWLVRNPAQRARALRRKRRLEGLAPFEEAELTRLHAILDRPTRDEVEQLREEEERDRRRFHGLLDEFDRIITTLRDRAGE